MKKTPIDKMLEDVDWQEVPADEQKPGDLPHITHRGFLQVLPDVELLVYTLSDGSRVIDGDSFESFFGDLLRP